MYTNESNFSQYYTLTSGGLIKEGKLRIRRGFVLEKARNPEPVVVPSSSMKMLSDLADRDIPVRVTISQPSDIISYEGCRTCKKSDYSVSYDTSIVLAFNIE